MESAVAWGTDKTLEETIDLLLDAAVSHQLERPELALALEQVESVLPLDSETLALTHYNEHRNHVGIGNKPPITRMPGVSNKGDE